jgi:hypothetical protein
MRKLLVLVLTLSALSACSMRFEFGYHGQTGRDDRIQTELLTKRRASASEKY